MRLKVKDEKDGSCLMCDEGDIAFARSLIT